MELSPMHTAHLSPRRPPRRSAWPARLQLSCVTLCLVIGLWLTFGLPWLWRVTMPQAHSGALWRAKVPGFDLGLDAYPAAPGEAGYIELWAYVYPYDDDGSQTLLYLFGTPALPLEPPLRAAPPAEPAAPIPRVPLPEEMQIRL
jgi:hypothetical protein